MYLVKLTFERRRLLARDSGASARELTGPPDGAGEESREKEAGRSRGPGAGLISKGPGFPGWSRAAARRIDLHLHPPESEKLLWRLHGVQPRIHRPDCNRLLSRAASCRQLASSGRKAGQRHTPRTGEGVRSLRLPQPAHRSTRWVTSSQ